MSDIDYDTMGKPKLPNARKHRTVITEELKQEIVRDFHDLKLTFLQISRKRNLCFAVCKKICEQNEYGFWTNPPRLAEGVKHQPVTKKREKLTDEERKMKVSDDALEIIELAMQEMKKKLIAHECSANQLKDFVNSVIPYIIKKPDTSSKQEDKEDKIKDDAKKVHSMFKESQNN